MTWRDKLNGDPIPWLLEDDPPGVRYLTMKDVLDSSPDDPELLTAKDTAYEQGPIAVILDELDEEGYWVKPGPGYNPKYRSAVWSLIMLAQLGASVEYDQRIKRACDYLMDQSLTSNGQFSTSGTPSTTVDCLQGNMCWTLVKLGYDDPRLKMAYDWMARSVTGEGVAPSSERKAALRYYAGKCGPGFACGANNKLPCAWGAAKVILAFSLLPEDQRTQLIENAIHQGVDFLFSVDPAEADYPCGWNDKPSRNWWKFGFPVFYITDLLQIIEALVGLGYGKDHRLANSMKILHEKQDERGRWPLEYSYTGKTWVDFGPKKEPNKWVTMRAMRVYKGIGEM
jgi:hypothetical protein